MSMVLQVNLAFYLPCSILYLKTCCRSSQCFGLFQVTWGRRTTLSPHLSITVRVELKLSCSLGIFLMLTDITEMTLEFDGIHGVVLLKKLQHTSLGFGLLEIMR